MILDTIVRIELFWRLMDCTLLRVTRSLDAARRRYRNSMGVDMQVARTLQGLCPTSTVQRGMFTGLQLPVSREDGQSHYSIRAPQLLGLYERPLQNRLFGLVSDRGHDLFIDVGCADGFYAVGFAMALRNIQVIAFDIDPAARDACARLAVMNGVADRISVREKCDPETLTRAVQGARRALILSDCEGYERELFTPEVATLLKGHDIVIEVHDHLRPTEGVTQELLVAFNSTHETEWVEDVDDMALARRASSDTRLADLPWPIRTAMVSENRRYAGAWLIAKGDFISHEKSAANAHIESRG